MAKLPPWSMRKITDCAPEGGPHPQGGDFLRFQPSGRMYQVMRRRGKTMHCMVLPDDFDTSKEPADAKVWYSTWVSSSRKERR